MTTNITDDAVRTMAAGAALADLWAPWGDRGTATAADLSAMLARPHRSVRLGSGTVQVWARGNAHVIEFQPAA